MEEEEDQEKDQMNQTSSTSNSKSRRRIVELTRNSKSTKVKIVDRSTGAGRSTDRSATVGRFRLPK